MVKFSRYILIKSAYIIIDLAVMCLCIYVVSWARQSTLAFPVTWHTLFLSSDNPYRFVLMFWILITIVLNNSNGLYETKREYFETFEVGQILKSVGISTLVTIVLLYIIRIEIFPRSIVVFNALSMAVAFTIWRLMKRFFVEYLVSKGYNNFNALVIGAGRVGCALTNEINTKPGLGIKIVGYLDDFKSGSPEKGKPDVIGKISDFSKIARREFINKVFITIHHDSKVFLEVLREARDLGIAVRVVPQGFDLTPSEFFKYNIGVIPILEYCDVQNLHKQVGKRLFDFIVSLFLIFIFLPVLALIAIMIKFDNPGPMFYLSKRFGRRGRIFKMYKFRSMVQDAEKVIDKIQGLNEVDGPIFKMKKDPRITPFGQLLRKYSLDELPQLFNVLKGEMSLVGPRPLPIKQVQREDLRQLRRLEVRPGITGLWQIRGRSDVSFKRLVKWDVWYIKNWSFWLDLNILLQTFPAVIKGKGAY